MRGEIVSSWRGLPEWMRRDILRGSREYWIYSGLEEIGWEHWGGWGLGSGLPEEVEVRIGVYGEGMVTNIIYLMEYIRGLVGQGEWSGTRSGDKLVLEYRSGEDIFIGYGFSREEAIYKMLMDIGEWYWDEKRPSLGNISKSELVSEGEWDGELMVDVREEGGGLEIRFEDFWLARIFMGKWHRFVLEENKNSLMGTLDYYHGRIMMVEGEAVVISGGTSKVHAGYAGGAWCASSSGVSGINYNVSGVDGVEGITMDDLMGMGGGELSN